MGHIQVAHKLELAHSRQGHCNSDAGIANILPGENVHIQSEHDSGDSLDLARVHGGKSHNGIRLCVSLYERALIPLALANVVWMNAHIWERQLCIWESRNRNQTGDTSWPVLEVVDWVTARERRGTSIFRDPAIWIARESGSH